MSVGAIVLVVYAAGYLPAAVLLARSWFKEYGAEVDGAGWGLLAAVGWPLVLPVFLVKKVAGHGL